MQAEIFELFEFMAISIMGLIFFGILLYKSEYADDSILIPWITSITIIVFVFLIMNNYIYNLYDKNSQYIQKTSYSISSKEIVRKKDKITYKLNFKIESSFIFNNKDIYITKEEYDLLKKSNEIPFIVNTKTKSIKLDEEKFAELIKSLKDKEDTK